MVVVVYFNLPNFEKESGSGKKKKKKKGGRKHLTFQLVYLVLFKQMDRRIRVHLWNKYGHFVMLV